MFVCHTVLSVPCSLVVTCWQRADLLALLYMMFSCVFVIFQCGVLCQVCRDLIVSIPDFCLLTYFYKQRCGNSHYFDLNINSELIDVSEILLSNTKVAFFQCHILKRKSFATLTKMLFPSF